jgi:hypothetical protein
MAATIFLSLGFVLLVVISFAGDAIVWSLGPYRRFKDVTHALETAKVTRVHGSKINGDVTVRNMGHRRLHEIFEISLQTDAQVLTCFGAIYIKKESIEDSLAHLQLSCGIAWIAMLAGTLVVLVGSPEKQAEVAALGTWEKVPRIFNLVFSAHWVLLTELLLVAFLVLSLATSSMLLHKIEKALQ